MKPFAGVNRIEESGSEIASPGVRFMSRKTIYLMLAVLGFLLPYSQFVPWLVAHGLDWRLFLQELHANRIGAFFVMDVLMSAVTLFVLIGAEQRKLGGGGWWIPKVSVLLVGVSLGLPVFLYMREKRLAIAQPGLKVERASPARKI
jgi:Terpene cyclase DEP1